MNTHPLPITTRNLQHVLLLNRRGGQQLVVGHITAALGSLHQALHLLKQVQASLNDPSLSSESAARDALGGPSSSTTSTHATAMLTDTTLQITYTEPLASLTGESFFAFGRALVFPDDATAVRPHDSQTQHLLCAGVIFNLALAYHCKALQEVNGKILQTAAALYALSSNLATKFGENCALTSMVAILSRNNEAQIYYMEGEYGRASQSLGRMARSLRQHVALADGSFDTAELEALMLNLVMMSQTPTVAKAA